MLTDEGIFNFRLNREAPYIQLTSTRNCIVLHPRLYKSTRKYKNIQQCI